MSETSEEQSIATSAVVFDLFHTLTGMATASPDLPATAELLGFDRREWNRALFEGSRWRLSGEERDPVAIVRRLARGLDPTIPEDRVLEAARVRAERFRRALASVPPENLRTLERLKAGGLALGLVSNADAMEIDGWAASPLKDRLDAAVFSCEVGHVKPETAIYACCLDRLRISAEDSIFVGDGGSRELEGARRVGMRTVLVSGVVSELWPDELETRRLAADLEISRVPEILEVPGVDDRVHRMGAALGKAGA